MFTYGEKSDDYSAYIPCDTDTRELEENVSVKVIRDGFKEDNPLTKEIPAYISFSDLRFSEEDRGRRFSDLIERLL